MILFILNLYSKTSSLHSHHVTSSADLLVRGSSPLWVSQPLGFYLTPHLVLKLEPHPRARERKQSPRPGLQPGASFEGAGGPSPPPPSRKKGKKKRSKKKEKRERKEKKERKKKGNYETMPKYYTYKMPFFPIFQ